ncbi:MAG TPA: amino acid adenylation domain-containing protein, partial [Telluria sp.]|nr:amino acid adenylation domain-containing protein [Telluria sp.]
LAQRCAGVQPPAPLFGSLLNYRHSRPTVSTWQGTRVVGGDERTNFPLTVSVSDFANAFVVHAQCVARIGAQRIATYLLTALEGLAAALEEGRSQPACTLPVLPDEERSLLLDRFNATTATYPRHTLLQQLFEAQCAIQADAPAAVLGAGEITYAQLNERANRIAHRLLVLGAKPDDRVAICLERSFDMVAGLLGILKAGCGYVPLDPAYPQDRLDYMLADCAPAAILTQASLRARLHTGAPVLVLDDAAEQSKLAAANAENPDPLAMGLTAANLAYVIYTSGSTGQPKGVAMPQSGLLNLIAWQRGTLPGSHGARTLQFAALGFDVAFQEIFSTLCGGDCLVLIDETVRQDPRELVELVRAQRVERMFLPFIALQNFADAADGVALPDLRTVVTAGEQLRTSPALRRLFAAGTGRLLHNHYGPTESHVVTAFTLPADPDEWSALPPIGKPIANARIRILDANGQLVPAGVAGEIHIGGVGVARGYLNRQELTAERFINDPFLPGGRLYKTGDLGRWLPDGNIDYLGRNDFQVKIRGFRVELGEIEAALAACAGVREAAVLAREDQPGDKRLVAYLVGEADTAELRAALAASLPEYMIPSAFMRLDAFPLTPNGKLDRKALPAPDQSAVIARAYTAPAGPVETALAAIWRDLLKFDRVGRDDHFFELGGHSLLVISLIERLGRQGVRASVRDVFDAPVLAALAERIGGVRTEHAEPAVPPNRIAPDCHAITPDMLPLAELTQEEIDIIAARVPGGCSNIQDIYPLAPLQQGILFHHLMEQQGDAYLLRWVISFDSRTRLDAYLAALQQVINRHDALRTAIAWEGLRQPMQVVQRRAALPVNELACAAGDDALTLLLERSDPRRVRLDLARAPLMAATTVCDGDEWMLALHCHHIVTDHISIERIVDEMRSYMAGTAGSLPAPQPYRDFIAQLRSVPEAEHEAWFRSQLGDIDEPTLGFGLLDVHGSGARIDEAVIELDAGLAERVRAAARERGVSPAVLFHVAWAQVLALASGRDDVVFGTT